MARFERFTFLVDTKEKRMIADLAKRLQRSRSDAVRFVVVNAASELAKNDSSKSNADLAEIPAMARGDHENEN